MSMDLARTGRAEHSLQQRTPFIPTLSELDTVVLGNLQRLGLEAVRQCIEF